MENYELASAAPSAHARTPMQALTPNMHALSRAESRNRSAAVGRQNPTIDQVMVEERAAAFTKRSIKTSPNFPG